MCLFNNGRGADEQKEIRKDCVVKTTSRTNGWQNLVRGLCLIIAIAASRLPAVAVEFPGPQPGNATAELDARQLVLKNAVIRATWSLADGQIKLVELTDRIAGIELRPRAAELFVIELADGRKIRASDLKMAGKPAFERIEADAKSIRLSGRFPGWKATVPLVSADGKVQVSWMALIRDQANCVRQELTISPVGGALPIKQLTVIDFAAPAQTMAARTVGAVDGSPVFSGNLFFACEHPMAHNVANEGRITSTLPRFRPISPGEKLRVAWAFGVVPTGQLRRGFLYYVERQRVRPYSPFVYYISWFDLAWPNHAWMTERQCLDVIRAFGDELSTKRGVALDAFVFDDGWDDNKTLWRFHPTNFPNGFALLQKAAAKYNNAVLGSWISPWGGYSQAKADRLKYGKAQGFETNARGFSLNGPKYYKRFSEVCMEHIKNQGVGYMKFDGTGKGDEITGPGEEYGPDIEALMRLIIDMRAVRPELFVNATVGTWPSPYWLWYSDSVWRAGRDCGWDGDGSTRQQWLTYRDGVGYRLRTARGPLFPLNSLKFQSVMLARSSLAGKLTNDPKDVIDDIHMAAASGTQMQEFFVTSAMMTPELWDTVAETIGWMRANTDVLVDTHGIGGDPAKLQVYGYASWSPRKGVLVLRNPSGERGKIAVDLQKAFELPDEAPRRYSLRSPWKADQSKATITLQAGQPYSFDLAPFEVLVFDAMPAR